MRCGGRAGVNRRYDAFRSRRPRQVPGRLRISRAYRTPTDVLSAASADNTVEPSGDVHTRASQEPEAKQDHHRGKRRYTRHLDERRGCIGARMARLDASAKCVASTAGRAPIHGLLYQQATLEQRTPQLQPIRVRVFGAARAYRIDPSALSRGSTLLEALF